MNLFATYYRLFRFLICPSRFLLVLMLGSLLVITLIPLLLLLGAPEWIQAFYPVAAMLIGIMILTLQPQMALLASRKTIVLCGNAGLHISVITTLMLALAALVMAPIAAHPFDDPAAFSRVALLWFSGLTLMMALGVLAGFNMFFLAFFLLAISGFETVFSSFEFWIHSNSPSLYGFALCGLLAWWLMYTRLRHGRLRKTFHLWEAQSVHSDKEWIAKSGIFNFLPRLRIGNDKVRNWSVLVLESGYFMRDYLALFLVSVLVPAGIFYLLQWWLGVFSGVSVFTAWALILLFVPTVLTVGSVGNLAANLRRLWLLMPGGRRQHMLFLERQLLKMWCLVAVTGWLPAAILLIVAGEPPLWSMAFLLFVGTQLAAMFYMYCFTVVMDSLWVLVARVCFGFMLIGVGVFCWFSRDLWWPLVAAAITCLLCWLLRPLAFGHWQQVDMSRLRLLEMNPWNFR